MQSIQHLILSHNEDQFHYYMNVLSSVIRANLDHINEENILLSREIEFLRNYVEIERLRFGENLQVHFHIKVQDTRVMVPPMLIQPMIEYVIRHGLQVSNEFGRVNVTFTQTGTLLTIEVAEEGDGHPKERKKNRHLSKGIDIVRKRLAIINERFQTDSNRIQVNDVRAETGHSRASLVLTLTLN
jgi:LytS/YehU family sensor histidine kinase